MANEKDLSNAKRVLRQLGRVADIKMTVKYNMTGFQEEMSKPPLEVLSFKFPIIHFIIPFVAKRRNELGERVVNATCNSQFHASDLQSKC
jgi:hypothetical protein